jgi:hypothetical protein
MAALQSPPPLTYSVPIVRHIFRAPPCVQQPCRPAMSRCGVLADLDDPRGNS